MKFLNINATINVKPQFSGEVLKAGTPLDISGAIANSDAAVGLVANDTAKGVESIAIVTEGTIDLTEVAASYGEALSDDCIAALKGITFLYGGKAVVPSGSSLPDYSEASNGDVLSIDNGAPAWKPSGGAVGECEFSGGETATIVFASSAERKPCPQWLDTADKLGYNYFANGEYLQLSEDGDALVSDEYTIHFYSDAETDAKYIQMEDAPSYPVTLEIVAPKRCVVQKIKYPLSIKYVDLMGPTAFVMELCDPSGTVCLNTTAELDNGAVVVGKISVDSDAAFYGLTGIKGEDMRSEYEIDFEPIANKVTQAIDARLSAPYGRGQTTLMGYLLAQDGYEYDGLPIAL